ncbi:MAG: RIP metalloprotease RseP [Thermodesulfobacteriota bacterium]
MHVLMYYILPLVIVLGVLIFCHELGHFLVAKLFDVKVLRFSLGFGHKLVARTIGETEYRISAIPLGGYVKMLGESEGDEGEEPIPPSDLKRAFNMQHPLKRIAIVAAGPAFNFFLAFLLFCGLHLAMGAQIMLPEVGQVSEGSPADLAGIKKGDVILSVEGRPVASWEDLKGQVEHRAGDPLVFLVRRSDRTLGLTVTPEHSSVKNIFGEEVSAALIGIVASGEFETVKLGFGKAVVEAASRTWEVTKLTILTVVKLFQRIIPMETVGGPIMIGQMTGQIAQESFLYLIPFMAIISINLGILNLLPVPILDGGVIVFLFLELIIGKPLGLRKREIAQKIGLFLLITLMVVVFYNDIARLFRPLFQ